MKKLIYSLLSIILLLFGSCKKDETGITEVAPIPPSGLAALVVSPSQIDLTWTDNSTNEIGYKIERKTSGGLYNIVATTAKDVNIFSDISVSSNNSFTYRVYSFNSAGNSLSYSNEVTVSTNVPLISTTSLTNLGSNTVITGGNVTNSSSFNISARGVVWSTSPSPTVNLSTKTNDGTGLGSFISNISGLNHSTTYYIRAYATNSLGTFYGNEIKFTTMKGGDVVAGGRSGSEADTFSGIRDVWVDSNGNILIADADNGRIQKWASGASSGVTVAGVTKSLGSNANQLNNPFGICLDNSGNLYIADSGNNRIQKWSPGANVGVTVAGGNGRGSNANQLADPYAVAVDINGNIYVSDLGNYRIQKWAPGAKSGETVGGGNGQGPGANQITPLGITLDSQGNIYCTDYDNHRIQKIVPGSKQGITVAGGKGQGSSSNQLYGPHDVFVDLIGNIFVADYGNNRIQKWSTGATNGVTVAGGNGQGSATNQMSPMGVFVDSSGNIYIADRLNFRILKWNQ